MNEPHDLHAPGLRDRAVRAARGEDAFDLLITGGTLVRYRDRRAAPRRTRHRRSADRRVLPPGGTPRARAVHDAAGKFLAPGLIDSHLHIESSMVTPRHYAETVVPQGTTTICWDPHELGNVLGLDGVRWAIEASRDLPLRVLVLAPSCVPSAPGLERAGAVFGAEEMQTMLAWPGIAGVAEVMDMRGVLNRSALMAGIVDAGLASGKLVCGHARGLAGDDLQGFAAAGIESDHEITSGDDLLAKLRAGFTVELRGSHDYVLPGAVAALKTLPVLPQTLTICTDDVFPDDLADAGGMIDVLRRLVRYGMAPVDVLRAATLHAAMRLGRRDLGLLAPGRRADLIVLADLDALGVDARVRLGPARGGAWRAAGAAAAGRGAAAARHGAARRAGCGGLPPDRAEHAHRPRAAAHGGPAALHKLGRDRPRRYATAWRCCRTDATLMAVLHRHGLASPEPHLGVLRGWGTWHGALATTVSHDSHNLVVFGRDPADMAAAANAVIAAQGGMAVARRRRRCGRCCRCRCAACCPTRRRRWSRRSSAR